MFYLKKYCYCYKFDVLKIFQKIQQQQQAKDLPQTDAGGVAAKRNCLVVQ